MDTHLWVLHEEPHQEDGEDEPGDGVDKAQEVLTVLWQYMSTNDERSEQEPTSPQGCNDTDATAPHDCASHLYMNSAAVPGGHNGFSSDYWYQIRSFLLAGRGG